MNRKKKINQIFKSRLKKAKAKLNPAKKQGYISKAERAKAESIIENTQDQTTETTDNIDQSLSENKHPDNAENSTLA